MSHSLVFRAQARRWFLTLAAATGLWVGLLPAGAIIDAALQLQLGNPSGATANPNDHNHYLIQRTVEAMDYSDALGEANWVSWDLTAGDVGSSGRSSFSADPDLPAGFTAIYTGDYTGSGFDRGHMCPSADRTVTVADNDQVFYMSNIIPQAADNNQGVWANFETYCRTLAQAGNELLITCGPGGFAGARISSGKVAIPTFTWKIAVVVPLGSSTALSRISAATRVIALKIPNSNGVSAVWQNFVTSASQIQRDTGLSFFTALPVSVASALRSKVDGLTDPPPAIVGFSPSSGAPNATVVITGTNFTSAQSVSFNGASAAFNVDSPTQITATVPTNANSGPIGVSTPSGTTTSAAGFIVGGTSVPDLTLTLTHAGNFTQGDLADAYTITVTNLGNTASTGIVTVATVLPAGLMATALAGSGWTANLGALTCTRSNALAAGAAYPPITVTISVATNAPANVTTFVTVAGGGDANPANNSASDQTAILVPGAGAFTGILVAWDVSGQTSFGASPLAPTTQAANLTLGSLTRGTGLTTSGSGAARAWGANSFAGATAAAAVNANQSASFTVAANAGFRVSFASISRFDYRRSNTGPANGVLQYQIGSGEFTNIGTLTYSSSANTGASLGPIDLTGVAPLQDVGPGTTVTFRIVNWGASGSTGNWYLFDVAASSAPDFAVQGTVTPLPPPVADLALSLNPLGTLTQGDTGDAYSVTVTNLAAGPSAGPVKVSIALPSGLTATVLQGAGWTTDLASLTCTRTDALAAGGVYPPITLLVNVLTNAPGTVTTSASVSGGGETNAANNTASVASPIVALTPIQAWRLYWFGTTADYGLAADTTRATGDGLPNLLKYALGLNPLLPTNSPVLGDISTGYLRLTWPRNPGATDVTCSVEVRNDLATPWTTNGTTVDLSNPAVIQVRDNTPVASAPSRLMRLRVSRP